MGTVATEISWLESDASFMGAALFTTNRGQRNIGSLGTFNVTYGARGNERDNASFPAAFFGQQDSHGSGSYSVYGGSIRSTNIGDHFTSFGSGHIVTNVSYGFNFGANNRSTGMTNSAMLGFGLTNNTSASMKVGYTTAGIHIMSNSVTSVTGQLVSSNSIVSSLHFGGVSNTPANYRSRARGWKHRDSLNPRFGRGGNHHGYSRAVSDRRDEFLHSNFRCLFCRRNLRQHHRAQSRRSLIVFYW